MESSCKPDLKHLLNEDQEPFVLINYINEKRCERAKAPIHVVENPRFSASLSRHYSCLFSLPDSPDMKKPPPAPLYEFSSKFGATPKSVFVHVPPGTAAMLLEAALRIEKSQLEKSKSLKNVGLGFFGSIMRKIKRRKKDEKRRGGEVEGVVRWEEQPKAKKPLPAEVEEETTLGFEEEKISGNKDEEKFIDIESTSSSTSTSTSTSRCEETECIGDQERDSRECNSDETFKELESPAASPAHRNSQVAKNEGEHLTDGKERKEETEHFSPISVFDLDVEGQDEDEQEDEDEDDEDDRELERSFAFVHNARRKLLKKLRRFEKLAGMNPLDLEKRITEDDESEDDDEDDSVESETSETSTAEVLNVSNYSNQRRVPLDTKRLVIALMREDGALTAKSSNRVLKSHKLRKRLNLLKNIERNTINMMVQMDFRAERNEWQKNREHVEETVVEIEFAVFGFLVEELSAEMVHSNNLY